MDNDSKEGEDSKEVIKFNLIKGLRNSSIKYKIKPNITKNDFYNDKLISI